MNTIIVRHTYLLTFAKNISQIGNGRNLALPRSYTDSLLKGGDRRVRIFSAHNNWWATPEVSLPLPYQCSAKSFLIFLGQGAKTMYYFKNMHSKSLKCVK